MVDLIDKYLSEACESYDITMMKVDAVMEAAERELNINHAEAELKVMKESGTADDLAYLYEAANNGLVETVIAAIKKIKDAIVKFFSDIKDKILEMMEKDSDDEKIEKLEKKVKLFPLLGKKKVMVENYDEQTKAGNKAISALNKLKAKFKSGQNVDEDEVDDVVIAYKKDHARLVGVASAIAVTVSGALVMLKAFSKNSRQTLNANEKMAKDACEDCIELAKKGDNPKVAEAICRAATDIAKFMQENFVRAYTSIKRAIADSIRSIKNTKVDVSKALVNESSDEEDINKMEDMDAPVDTAKVAEEDGEDPIDSVEPGEGEVADGDPWDDVMTDLANVGADEVPEEPVGSDVSEDELESQFESMFDEIFGDDNEQVTESSNDSSDDDEGEDINALFESVLNEAKEDETEKEVVEESAFDKLMSQIDDLF